MEVGSFQTSKYYIPGLGYSPSSGPASGGGYYVDYSPYNYSSTFYGSDVKGLLPFSFGKNKKTSKRKNRKTSNKKNRKTSKRKNRKTSKRKFFKK